MRTKKKKKLSYENYMGLSTLLIKDIGWKRMKGWKEKLLSHGRQGGKNSSTKQVLFSFSFFFKL